MDVAPVKVRSRNMKRILFARGGLVLAVLGLVLWRCRALWEDTKHLSLILWSCGIQESSGKPVTAQRWSEVIERPWKEPSTKTDS